MATADSVAAVLHGIEDLRLLSRPVEAPGPGQVRLRVAAVGICGSDLHYWSHAKIKGQVMELPTSQGFQGVMGHEASGVVESLGPGVTSLAVGDRVALEAGVPCGACPTCAGGRYNLCPKVRFLGSFLSRCPGALAQLLVHPAAWCHKLPDNVSLDEAAVLEPLNVALAAVRKAGVGPGQRVLVTGGGAVGLLTMMAARAAGATHVLVTDTQEQRLAMASKLGASEVANARGMDVAASVKSGAMEPFDSCIECSGVDACIAACIRACRSGGKCVLVGIGAANEATIPLGEATQREIDLIGVFRYCNAYAAAIQLVASGAVDVRPLVSHHYALDDVADAFRTALAGGNAVKVLIHPNATREQLPPPPPVPLVATFAGKGRMCPCCGLEAHL